MRTLWKLVIAASVVAGTLAVAGSAAAQENPAAALLDTDGLCDATDADVASVVSVSTTAGSSRSQSRNFRLDETDVLISIALARNGIEGGSLDRIATVEETTVDTADASQTTDVDRDGVLSAIALGAGGVDEANALACASDTTQAARVETSMDQDVVLDENSALLAIALVRNGDDNVTFEDVAGGTMSSSREVSVDREVNIDREDALLLLAFGP